MTARRRTSKPRQPVATIQPAGDVGRFRVCHPDGTYSDPVTLAEAREIVRLAELERSPISYR